MRGSFFSFSDKTLKIMYRVLGVIVAAIIIFFSLNFLFYTGIRRFYPLEYSEEVKKYAKEYELDQALVYSIIKVESGFNEKAQSKKGAQGLMQITESTGKYIAEKLKVTEYDLKNGRTNIYFGCYYLRYLFSRFKKLETVIAAYNAGEGKVTEWLNDSRYSDDNKTLTSIPFRETREYIKKIKKTFVKYNKLYGNILDKRQNFE